MNVKITCDSTCDLSPELIERYNISVASLYVTLGDNSLRDGLDVKPDDIYDYFKETGNLAKTSAINISDYTEFFEANKSDDTEIVHFSLSGEMSTTYNNARLAAEDVGNVYVIDTKNLSSGSALLVLKACDFADEGLSASEIAERINGLVPKVNASFVIDNLEFLHKGGRCSSVAALGANVLKLKPCIEVKDGKMGMCKKYRGKYDVVIRTYVKERLGDINNIDLRRIFVTHSGCDKKLMKEIVQFVRELAPFEEVIFCRAGCTISAHCGPNTMGVLFIEK